MSGVVDIALDRIEIVDRARPVASARVDRLAASMATEGLRAPVLLKPIRTRNIGTGKVGKAVMPSSYRVIVGAARVEAARQLEWKTIRAELRDGIKVADAAALEIDDNLSHSDLTKLESALMLAARKRLYEQENPESRNGAWGSPAKYRNENDNLSFSKFMADRIGVHHRTIERMVRRGQEISRAAADTLILNGSPVADCDVDLDSLAGLAANHQIEAAQWAVAADTGERRRIRKWREEHAGKPAGNVHDFPKKSPLTKKDQENLGLTRLQGVWFETQVEDRLKFADWLHERGEITAAQAEKIKIAARRDPVVSCG